MATSGKNEDVSNYSNNRIANITLPDVIKFGYKNYLSDVINGKCKATCKRCDKVISENMGTTSAFTRHMSSKPHPQMRNE